MLITSSKLLDIGDEFKIRCLFFGEVLWLRYSAQSDVLVPATNSTVIEISKFTPSDAGSYYCYGSPQNELSKFIAHVKVTVKCKM